MRHGSQRSTTEACVRLMSHAPARIERRKMVVGGSFWNSSRALVRTASDMSPERERYWRPRDGDVLWHVRMMGSLNHYE